MNVPLTKAEERALEATKLPPFSVNLHEIRRVVSLILEMFGRSNIFPEYTVHNYNHVHSMLSDLEWLIPDSTKKNMTPADWLMVVMSIYFHDIGLIVTEDEFKNRSKTNFGDFCDSVLFSGRDGGEYRSKILALGPEAADRFFYQEFVRHNHGLRVRAWIEGRADSDYGYASAQVQEIAKIIATLDDEFKRDLALICESHNLDDIDDIVKYKPFKPYGSTPETVANLSFSAVVLRTCDLLQITNQRAPSVLYRLISPIDPISQNEWAKQNSVKGIFPKPAVDADGNKNSLAADTLSVFAKFDNENGFFGLTSYLRYAETQLNQSSRAISKSNAKLDRKYDFPWKKIDDSTVEAVGFIPTPFEFKIDQAKILDLLTGHTLYNDSSVCVRELVQNSIDAVRLQSIILNQDSNSFGKIKIHWETETSTLSITDNGTGMTQEIIEKHLLSVGSSRYQDSKFREDNPNFHSISRFGIGVLSAFMVADNVQITTVSVSEPKGRRISLRSVHGKYLIKLINKNDPELKSEIGDFGTKIVIRMRSTAEEFDIIETLKTWILFPRCDVRVTIDRGIEEVIGFNKTIDAIDSFISSESELFPDRANYKVKNYEFGFMDISFAIRYSSHFKEMSFVEISDRSRLRRRDKFMPVGLCVEGIRVEFSPPGFYRDGGLLCIADCKGASAPKTNVSRSSLEGKYDDVFENAFRAYHDFIKTEIARLQSEEGFSLSYAVQQFPFIAQSVLSGPVSEDERIQLTKSFPMFVVEEDSKTYSASADEIISKSLVWTVESNAISALMSLLRDTRSKVTARQVVEFCSLDGPPIPEGCLVTNLAGSNITRSTFDEEFQIQEIFAYTDERRLDARWVPKKISNNWVSTRNLEYSLEDELSEAATQFRRLREQSRRHSGSPDVRIPLEGRPSTVGLDGYTSALCNGSIYIVPGTPVSQFLNRMAVSGDIDDKIRLVAIADVFMTDRNSFRPATFVKIQNIEYFSKEMEAKYSGIVDLNISEFIASVRASGDGLKVFNAFAWSRIDSDGIEF